MCCLKYEHDNYESAKDSLPTVGRIVITSFGTGKVLSLNTNDRTAKVHVFDAGRVMDLPFDDIVEQETSNV
jgi:cell fate regulator YaaT (PSP1 superfamily)